MSVSLNIHGITDISMGPINRLMSGGYYRTLTMKGEASADVTLFSESEAVLMTQDEAREDAERQAQGEEHDRIMADGETLGFHQGYIPDPSCAQEFLAYTAWKGHGGRVETAPPLIRETAEQLPY